MNRPPEQRPEEELQRLRPRIAEVVAARDALKREIETGAVAAAEGLRRLERLDAELSALDTAFKQRWDSQQ